MLSCPLEELLYGGAAGGGKTDALLGDFAAGIERYGGAWKGVIFRRSFPMLEEIELRSLEIFGPTYGTKCYSIGNKKWKFPTPNGTASLKFSFLDKDKDTQNHQGQQYTWVGWDELTQWPTPFCYTYLFSRLRSPKRMAGAKVPCYFRATTNPGGPGHTWVKHRFVDPAPAKHVIEEKMGDMMHRRVFIPAKVTNNLILMKNNPMYIYRLDQLSDPVLRVALKEGRWDIFAGQAFPEWNPAIHVIPSHKVPDGVTMWRSMNWGYAKPYSCLWFYADLDGNVIVCNQLYGQGDQVNEGSRESCETIRQKIETIEAENDWWVPMGYLDPQCWEADDSPLIFDKLGGAKLGWVKWSKGPHSRKVQKQMVHEYLQVINGESRLKFMDRCESIIRTLPALPLDEGNIEDVDTDAEDHDYDALRGGLVKRVFTRQERRRAWAQKARRHYQLQTETQSPYGSW